MCFDDRKSIREMPADVPEGGCGLEHLSDEIVAKELQLATERYREGKYGKSVGDGPKVGEVRFQVFNLRADRFMEHAAADFSATGFLVSSSLLISAMLHPPSAAPATDGVAMVNSLIASSMASRCLAESNGDDAP